MSLALVSGSQLEAQGVRDGDHVALHRRDVADHGDLAAVAGTDGRAALRRVRGDVPGVRGVVVGMLRRFGDA